MSYQYCQEAKDRIANLGPSEIINFISEISPALRRKAFGYLPKIPGFRVGHPTEIKEKQKRLLAYMLQTHSTPEEKFAWQKFIIFWKFWAEEHIGRPFNVFDKLSPDDSSGSNFIREIAKIFPKVAKEDVERLFFFSGFASTPEVTVAFELFHSKVVIARENMIDAIPIRIEEFAERIGVTERQMEEGYNYIKKIEAQIDELIKKINLSSNNEKKYQNSIVELKNSISKDKAKFDSVKSLIDELYLLNEKNEYLIIDCKESIDSNALVIKEVTDYKRTIDSIAIEIKDLKSSLIALNELERNCSALDDEKIYESIIERLEKVELNAPQLFSGVEPNRLKYIQEVRLNEEHQILNTHEDVLNIITSNLLAIGLTTSSSELVARLALATFISGQIIQFSGSLADIVADSIATAIGAPNYHVWRVPVGIVSDKDSFEFIESVADTSRCLVLKGANLSAFEIYGTAIRDVVVKRQLFPTSYDHMALIATWKQGPATFPDGGMLAELGPVIDTDSLKMRGLSANLPRLKAGLLNKNKWSEIEGLQVDNTGDYIDELRELLIETGFDGGVLWKRMIHFFYDSLIKIPNGNHLYDIYSVLFFYTLSWAKVKDGPIKTIEDIANRELKNFGKKNVL